MSTFTASNSPSSPMLASGAHASASSVEKFKFEIHCRGMPHSSAMIMAQRSSRRISDLLFVSSMATLWSFMDTLMSDLSAKALTARSGVASRSSSCSSSSSAISGWSTCRKSGGRCQPSSGSSSTKIRSGRVRATSGFTSSSWSSNSVPSSTESAMPALPSPCNTSSSCQSCAAAWSKGSSWSAESPPVRRMSASFEASRKHLSKKASFRMPLKRRRTAGDSRASSSP
mmetsp:Transcript_63196/g.87855  ORF Transcript_63196/g.87855 Transcript_63196/m.87855 type:complete len:228 (-) Transcript_63196:407-1090(-)